MPYEVMEEEGLNKIPDLKIAQWIFTLKSNPVSTSETLGHLSLLSSSPLSLPVERQRDQVPADV